MEIRISTIDYYGPNYDEFLSTIDCDPDEIDTYYTITDDTDDTDPHDEYCENCDQPITDCRYYVSDSYGYGCSYHFRCLPPAAQKLLTDGPA